MSSMSKARDLIWASQCRRFALSLPKEFLSAFFSRSSRYTRVSFMLSRSSLKLQHSVTSPCAAPMISPILRATWLTAAAASISVPTMAGRKGVDQEHKQKVRPAMEALSRTRTIHRVICYFRHFLLTEKIDWFLDFDFSKPRRWRKM